MSKPGTTKQTAVRLRAGATEVVGLAVEHVHLAADGRDPREFGHGRSVAAALNARRPSDNMFRSTVFIRSSEALP